MEGEDDANANKKGDIKDMYEPADIDDLYLRDEDVRIRTTDIPERLQIRYDKRKFPSNKELVEETKWIFEKLRQSAGDLKQDASIQFYEKLQKKILKTLEYLIINHNEIMYLSYYKKQELLPEIQLNDLWNIYDLDQEWAHFHAAKEDLQRSIDHLEQFHKVSLHCSEFL